MSPHVLVFSVLVLCACLLVEKLICHSTVFFPGEMGQGQRVNGGVSGFCED